ncbi:MAG: tetratricopeptide repeat protein [Gaiellaceae bacterium]
MAVIDVTDLTFEQDVIERSKREAVVVDFWAAWCGPCRMLTPVLEQETRASGLTLAKVDVDANPEVARRFGISGIPAVKAFVDGKVAAEFVGAQPPAQVKSFLAGLRASDNTADEGELKALLQRAVEAETTEPRLEARGKMMAIFDRLGPQHPLTKTYRKRLSDELY